MMRIWDEKREISLPFISLQYEIHFVQMLQRCPVKFEYDKGSKMFHTILTSSFHDFPTPALTENSFRFLLKGKRVGKGKNSTFKYQWRGDED